VELLRALALEQGFQVLLLTCSDRFDALADAVIVLEGPAMVLEGPAVLPPSAAGEPRPTELPAREVGASRPPSSEPGPASAAEPAAEGLWGVLSRVPHDDASGSVGPVEQAEDRPRGSRD
jgi:hypothetical protein